MPELPEVETVRQDLAPALVGQRFTRVEQRRADLRFALPERFAERLVGRRLLALDRRGKYLLAPLSGGDALIMHLGMTGRFSLDWPGNALTRSEADRRSGKSPLGAFVYETGADPKHDHVVFAMGNGATITYNDPRRFGFMLLAPQAEIGAHPLFRQLGLEPFDPAFDAAHLARRAHGRALDLKAFLMDQRVVAGLGNIYVSEALHRAGLSPNRRAASLAKRNGGPTDRAHGLVAAIRSVLGDAIAAGGATLRDYRRADGGLGYFQHAFQVYGREGEPCIRAGCRGTIRRGAHAGRSTFYCGVCQR